MAAVTIVCGPPGSGKSTYVDARRRWGDLVVDVDALYRALSGLDIYEKPDGLLSFVLAARDAVLELVPEAEDVCHTWVIMSGQDTEKRAELRERLNAAVVVLATSPSECLRRIARDPRRADKWRLWEPIVRRWWDTFRRQPGEQVIET